MNKSKNRDLELKRKLRVCLRYWHIYGNTKYGEIINGYKAFCVVL